MNVALIMAGGRGTRFWPASTEEKPKQFISLIAENTMLQETVRRILPLFGIERIFVCTAEKYKALCMEQLPDLPERNIIVEPFGRNTAPCILLSTMTISQIYPHSTIAVLPADASVRNEQEQLSVFEDAFRFIADRDGIVTVGIKPDRPETGYGYIQFSDQNQVSGSHAVASVQHFKEKPNQETAEKYIQNGQYLWNAGMFFFNADFMLHQFRLYAEDTYRILSSLPALDASDYSTELTKKYSQCEAISIDFAIMEKTDSLYVIPADFGWDDVGSWMALDRYLSRDSAGNSIKGDVTVLNSNHNTVFANTKSVILLDADDLFVIETEDRIVVGKRSSLPKVPELRDR